MSSMTITPQIQVSAVRLTRRGRLVILAAFIALAAALMIAFGGFATATGEAGTPTEVRTVTVAPGDTLYGLAADIAEPGEIRETVAEIKQLNAMAGSSLRVGDKIALPLN